jgi:hypothetical protein
MVCTARWASRRRTGSTAQVEEDDELLQPLMIHPEPLGHRLHHLASAVQQQPT